MGIPHLLRLLEPYAEPIQFTQSTGQPASVVIDGSALAYHAYRLALARRTAAEHALEAIPSYREVCETVLFWLESLEDHGLQT